jgi:hypothetical protein
MRCQLIPPISLAQVGFHDWAMEGAVRLQDERATEPLGMDGDWDEVVTLLEVLY